MQGKDASNSRASGVQTLVPIPTTQKVWDTSDKLALILSIREMVLPTPLQIRSTLLMEHQKVSEWPSRVLLEVQMMVF